MASVQDLERQLEQLAVSTAEPEDVSLPIHTPTGHILNTVPTFTGHKDIGRYRIMEDKSYSTDNTNYSKLIPKHKYSELNGRDLSVGYKSAKFIDNYQRYHELKQEFFLKWLDENNYFAKVSAKKYAKPDFICFGGRITDPMMSPEMERFGDWEIYATKFQDVIYLWDEKKDQDRVVDLASYYGVYFEHLLTNTDPSASFPNEYDKIYVINEVKFGTHQLLVMNEIDAEDETGASAELKVYKQCSPKGMKAKYLKYWAQSVVPGVGVLVIGKRDDGGRLRGITSTNTCELARTQGLNTRSCLDFEDRLLKWIKACFKTAESGDVKKFTWICGSSVATVTNVQKQHVPKYLLPTWFADKMKESSKKDTTKEAGKRVSAESQAEDKKVKELKGSVFGNSIKNT